MQGGNYYIHAKSADSYRETVHLKVPQVSSMSDLIKLVQP